MGQLIVVSISVLCAITVVTFLNTLILVLRIMRARRESFAAVTDRPNGWVEVHSKLLRVRYKFEEDGVKFSWQRKRSLQKIWCFRTRVSAFKTSVGTGDGLNVALVDRQADDPWPLEGVYDKSVSSGQHVCVIFVLKWGFFELRGSSVALDLKVPNAFGQILSPQRESERMALVDKMRKRLTEHTDAKEVLMKLRQLPENRDIPPELWKYLEDEFLPDPEQLRFRQE